jgi:hypothetical protein
MSQSDPAEGIGITFSAGSAEIFGLVSQLAQVSATGKLTHGELLIS